VVKQAGKQGNIIKNISSHTLRHTFATHLLEDGLDNMTIKDLLNHANVRK
jgi:integrase/recombinase XerD